MSAIRRFGCALIAALTLLAASGPAQAVERILLFISDVEVQRNGDLIVTETIRVQAEGREIRRGILRDFPTTYTRRDGTRVEVGFEVQSVTRNGRPEDYSTERLSNGVRIRIGSADRLDPDRRARICHHLSHDAADRFLPDFDELYWNATGTGWTLGIDVAEARITLPERVPFLQTAFYTGPQGAQGKDAR